MFNKLFHPIRNPDTTLLLMHMDESVKDDSPKNHPIQVVGNVTISQDQKKFGDSSVYFDGSGLNSFYSLHSDYDFLGSNFTIDFWCYPTQNATVGTSALFHITNSSNLLHGLHIHRNSGGFLGIDDGLYATPSGNIQIPLNAWSHIAVVRYNNTIYGFVNGIMSCNYPSLEHLRADRIQVGQYYVGNHTSNFVGYIDEIRIVKHDAKYFSQFDVPTEAYT